LFCSEVVAELGLDRWRSTEFWATFALLLCVLWLRFFPHYIGQWLFLQGVSVPASRFTGPAYKVRSVSSSLQVFLEYSIDNTDGLVVEVLMTFMGVVANLCIFALLMVVAKASGVRTCLDHLVGSAWLSACFWPLSSQRLVLVMFGCICPQMVLKSLPEVASQFMLCYGLGTVFDPLLILLVDCIVGDWSGDSFKLYQYFSSRVRRHSALENSAACLASRLFGS
jgi:hypothetical protein